MGGFLNDLNLHSRLTHLALQEIKEATENLEEAARNLRWKRNDPNLHPRLTHLALEEVKEATENLGEAARNLLWKMKAIRKKYLIG